MYIWAPYLIFIKLLTLLFSNVYVSFYVFVCCRSLREKMRLKGGNKQRN
jgi:hypothetical protein